MTKLAALALSTSLLLLAPARAIEVTHAGDAGPGSLRAAVLLAEFQAGPDVITFAPALSGATIRLQTQIESRDLDGVTIDASALARAVTIDGDSDGDGVADDTRLIFFAALSGPGMHLIGLHLTRGYAQVGGAILSDGNLTLTRCTFSGNVATLRGGAVDNEYVCEATHCTFSGNTAPTLGGALYNAEFAIMRLRHCTLAGNSAATGGDLYNYDSLHLDACIVSSLAGIGVVTGGGNLVNTPPSLAPLGAYGGPIPTRALLPGSPARDAAPGSAVTADQRGFPIVGTPDIGAYEAGTVQNYAAWSWEALPAAATEAERAADSDLDGDSRTNLLEYATLTDGAAPTATMLPKLQRAGPGATAIEFTIRASALDVVYDLERSHPGIGPWTSIAQVTPATNTIVSDPGVTVMVSAPTLKFTDASVPGEGRVFYRLRVHTPPAP